MSKKPDNNELDEKAEYLKVAESRVFSSAMNVAERYASSKKKVYRILQHAFEKLKEESARNRLQAEFTEQVGILSRMIRAYYKGLYRKIPTPTLLKILGGLIYFVWIIDLIPDFIPVLGLADDVAVIVWVYNGIKNELEDFENWESVHSINIDN